MSEPKRYHHFIKFYSKSFTDVTGARYCYPDAGMIEDKDGKYVEYEDYARLRSVAEDNKRECEATRIENARLKAEVERLRASSFVTAVPVEQYERVVKAGDACADAAYAHCMCQDCEELRDQWRDAKRGKQP